MLNVTVIIINIKLYTYFKRNIILNGTNHKRFIYSMNALILVSSIKFYYKQFNHQWNSIITHTRRR